MHENFTKKISRTFEISNSCLPFFSKGKKHALSDESSQRATGDSFYPFAALSLEALDTSTMIILNHSRIENAQNKLSTTIPLFYLRDFKTKVFIPKNPSSLQRKTRKFGFRLSQIDLRLFCLLHSDRDYYTIFFMLSL